MPFRGDDHAPPLSSSSSRCQQVRKWQPVKLSEHVWGHFELELLVKWSRRVFIFILGTGTRTIAEILVSEADHDDDM